MRSIFLPVCIGLILTALPATADYYPDARRAYEEHWPAHPEHSEQMVRQWHQRLFHREIGAPLLARWSAELRAGIAAPVAIAHMLASPEYYVTCGSRPEGFVRTTFVQIVGREPTRPEFEFWLNRLYHTDRAVVAQEMVTRYPPTWVGEGAVVVPQYEYRPPVIHYHHRADGY